MAYQWCVSFGCWLLGMWRYIHAYIDISYICIHTWIYEYTCPRANASCICTYIGIFVYVCMHMKSWMYIHTLVRMYSLRQLPGKSHSFCKSRHPLLHKHTGNTYLWLELEVDMDTDSPKKEVTKLPENRFELELEFGRKHGHDPGAANNSQESHLLCLFIIICFSSIIGITSIFTLSCNEYHRRRSIAAFGP